MPDTPSRALTYPADTELVYQLPAQMQALAEDVERELNAEKAAWEAGVEAERVARVADVDDVDSRKLDKTGGTVSGALTVDGVLTPRTVITTRPLVDPNNGLAPVMDIVPRNSDGTDAAVNMRKYVRVINGAWEIVNGAYTAVLLQVTDDGNVTSTLGNLYERGQRVYSPNNPPPGGRVTGSYTGDGAATRDIALSATPVLVIVTKQFVSGVANAHYAFSDIPNQATPLHGGFVNGGGSAGTENVPSNAPQRLTNGFRVNNAGFNLNQSSVQYAYIAFF